MKPGYILPRHTMKFYEYKYKSEKYSSILNNILETMTEIEKKINWIQRCNINFINFDFSDNDEARNYLLYSEHKDR